MTSRFAHAPVTELPALGVIVERGERLWRPPRLAERVADLGAQRIVPHRREPRGTGGARLAIGRAALVDDGAEHSARYERTAAELRTDGQLLCGGRTLTEGALVRGYFCEPTVAQLRLEHRLWSEELFLPVLLLSPVAGLEEAMEAANATPFGLTAGFYGAREELEWFLERIEAGVTYCNRPQGATTGAWPGYQPFGGWKGSGSTGKGGCGPYYVMQFMREQSRTVIREG